MKYSDNSKTKKEDRIRKRIEFFGFFNEVYWRKGEESLMLLLEGKSITRRCFFPLNGFSNWIGADLKRRSKIKRSLSWKKKAFLKDGRLLFCSNLY